MPSAHWMARTGTGTALGGEETGRKQGRLWAPCRQARPCEPCSNRQRPARWWHVPIARRRGQRRWGNPGWQPQGTQTGTEQPWGARPLLAGQGLEHHMDTRKLAQTQREPTLTGCCWAQLAGNHPTSSPGPASQHSSLPTPAHASHPTAPSPRFSLLLPLAPSSLLKLPSHGVPVSNNFFCSSVFWFLAVTTVTARGIKKKFMTPPPGSRLPIHPLPAQGLPSLAAVLASPVCLLPPSLPTAHQPLSWYLFFSSPTSLSAILDQRLTPHHPHGLSAPSPGLCT